MADIGEVGEVPELTKIAQAVVLHSDPPVCKCNLDNGTTLYDAPTDDSQASGTPGKCSTKSAEPTSTEPTST